MTNETVPPIRTTEIPARVGRFTMRFSSTPRGARLARRLAGNRLETWDIPYDSAAHDDIVLIVAELAANAVRHGRVPGRDFRLTLTAVGPSVRVEVTDARSEREPAVDAPSGGCDSGRGLLLVAALSARWGWRPRGDGPGKTVWAEYQLPYTERRTGPRTQAGRAES